MGLFLSGALCMFLVALAAHRRAVMNLGDAFQRVVEEVHSNSYEVGKTQGKLEALNIVARETDEYVTYKVSESLGVDYEDSGV